MSTKVLSNQRVTVLAGLASGITDWSKPLLSELTALTNVSGAVNWNSFDLNLQASDQQDDRTLTDGAGAQSRGFTNFGGNLQFVKPRVDDTASVFRTAYDLFSTPRVELVVAVRYGKSNALAPAAGDKWTVYHVIVDAVSFGENDVSKFYQVSLKARDDIAIAHIVAAATPSAVTLTTLATAGTVGSLIFASAEYEGWDITKAAEWSSSDESLLVEVHPGIFLVKGAGAPTITASYPGAAAATPVAITTT